MTQSTSANQMVDWESQFREWAKPPTKTEQDRCDNAVSVVRNAIKASPKLQGRNISIFLQGSYKNNTNVRKDSDVDIGIRCTDTFFYDLPTGITPEAKDIAPATYHYSQFKNEVEGAMVDYLGRATVNRGNKAIDIRENNYHVEADVTAFFQHRRYSPDGLISYGVELQTDHEKDSVINWPDQHYQNGVNKNNNTGTRYKSIVRVIKSLANEMEDAGIQAAEIPGFLIECLVWNVPNDKFQNQYYSDNVRSALIYLYENTKSNSLCSEWGEVNELKYLFRSNQKWTREQANSFIVAAWNYVGFDG